MEATGRQVSVKGEMVDLPEGVDHITENLYRINFDLISLAEVDKTSKEYKWFNPRRLGEYGDKKGQGFTPEQMNQLLSEIKSEGVKNPLAGQWEMLDGKLAVQLIDGERRYRCIDRLRDNDDDVYSIEHEESRKASEVYTKVLCRVDDFTDPIKSLKLAFSLTDNAVSWGDGAVVMLVKYLRECGYGDEQILEITNKKENWLRETDRLCALDTTTLNYLFEGKINRALALRLTNISDPDERIKWLEAAYEDAIEEFEAEKEKLETSLEKAIDKQDLAEAMIGEADSPEEVATLEEKAEEAEKKAEDKKQKLAEMEESGPQAKNPNLNKVIKRTKNKKGSGSSGLEKMLTPNKIQKQRSLLKEVSENEGHNPANGDYICSPEVLEACILCYDAILKGDEDILTILSALESTESLEDLEEDFDRLQPVEDEE